MTVNNMADSWCSNNRKRSMRLYTIALETTRVSPLVTNSCFVMKYRMPINVTFVLI